MNTVLRQFCPKLLAMLVTLAVAIPDCWCQPVIVTSTLETNRLASGASTVLHVFARIAPEEQTNTLQIFSWAVDLIVGGDPVLRIDTGALKRSASDNDPDTSSSGTPDGLNLRNIHDSFLNRTGAGHDEPVELFYVPVVALAPGTSTISVQAASGSAENGGDFIVVPSGDGPPSIGADYAQALQALGIEVPLTNLTALIKQNQLPGGGGNLVTISFPVRAEKDYTVEYSASLESPAGWEPLPNAPHNSGFADDTNSEPRRFYRIRATEKPSLAR